MTDVQANYLINTAPELKEPFIEILPKIFHFSRLSPDLLLQLFQYSKFVVLADSDRPVQQGTYGQDIYILIQGRLEVTLKNESGVEEQIDVIYKPFSMFGEQCILGEAATESFEARGEVLLLGIDMSALPDLLEGISSPESRQEDSAYDLSKDMYLIFADVLINRLHRLLKDQYKLMQKVVVLHQSQAYQTSWKQNVLLTTMFNEFSENQLSPKLEVHTILKETLELFIPIQGRLAELLENRPVNTEMIYLELVRLDSLEKLDSMSSLLMEIIQKLSTKALELEEYTTPLQIQSHDLPAIISLTEYLNEAYQFVNSAGILTRNLSKEQFLEGFLTGSYPDPFSLSTYLRDGQWITDSFNMAHLMYLICRTCIQKERELNQIIAGCISYLTTINVPRQNTQESRLRDQAQNAAIVGELIGLSQKCAGDDVKTVKERPPSSSAQASVEDLLADFGL